MSAAAPSRAASLPPVLLVGNFLSGWDGRRTYAEDLAERLGGAGVEVRRASRFAFKPARLADMLCASLGGRGAYRVALIDVYSGQAFVWAEAAARAARLAGRATVLVLHGGMLPEFRRRHPGLVEKLLVPADAIVAPSTFLKDEFAAVRPDIRLIANAVDLRLYPHRERAAVEPRLVWLRAFHSMYNPALALRVLARVRERYPSAALAMYGVDKGDGSLEACRRLAGELGVESRVRFPGVVPKAKVGEALAGADIFLNTTNVDNTPVSMVEAMACGLCVVSTSAGGVPHLAGDGRDALLVEAGDIDGMTRQVMRLLEEPELCARLSRAARAKAEQFSWDLILPRWLDLIAEAAGAAGRSMDPGRRAAT